MNGNICYFGVATVIRFSEGERMEVGIDFNTKTFR